MGFALFESSGTFNPASYGLVVGDTIQVVAVGGGKGGSGSDNNDGETLGSNGGTSSFGSFVSAPGGNAAVTVAGATPPLSGDSEATGSLGSDGEHGWGSTLWHVGSIWSPSLDYDLLAYISAHGAVDSIRNGGKTDLAENGYAYASRATSAGGRGGLGYGAGGGGGAYSHASRGAEAASGGKAGTVKIVSVKLTNLKAISVTVGTGGAGGSSTANGGKGANGCVAVFW
jgi:hypothetical protein